MAFKIKLFRGTDEIEFGVSNPMPLIAPKFQYEYNKLGKITKQSLNLTIKNCIYTGTPSSLSTDWETIKAFALNGALSIYIYDDTTLLYSYLTTDYDNSPIISAINHSEEIGHYQAYLKFDMTITATKGGSDVSEYDKVENPRWVEKELRKDRTKRKTVSAEATGTNAREWVLSKKPDDTVEQNLEEDKEQNSWSADYVVKLKATNGMATILIKDNISKSGGGNPRYAQTAMGNPPVIFTGKQAPVELTISGEYICDNEELVGYPERSLLDKYLSGGYSISKSVEENKLDGTPTLFKISYSGHYLMSEDDFKKCSAIGLKIRSIARFTTGVIKKEIPL